MLKSLIAAEISVFQPAMLSDLLLCCQEQLQQSPVPDRLGLANKCAEFIHSVGSYTLVYTVNSNSHALLSRSCVRLHTL